MKVLQSLGRHKPKHQEGIFQYRRTMAGIEIDMTVGQAPSVKNPIFTVSVDDWQTILSTLAAHKKAARLNRTRAKKPLGPTTSLYELIDKALPKNGWTDSHRAAICAVLEHEGSIDHYGGRSGPIVLKPDL